MYTTVHVVHGVTLHDGGCCALIIPFDCAVRLILLCGHLQGKELMGREPHLSLPSLVAGLCIFDTWVRTTIIPNHHCNYLCSINHSSHSTCIHKRPLGTFVAESGHESHTPLTLSPFFQDIGTMQATHDFHPTKPRRTSIL